MAISRPQRQPKMVLRTFEKASEHVRSQCEDGPAAAVGEIKTIESLWDHILFTWLPFGHYHDHHRRL